MSFGVVFFVVVAIVIGVFFASRPGQLERGRFLKRAGLSLMALSTLLSGAFAVGETFADPGGWKAVGLVAAWVVPLAGLAAVAWYRPDRAVRTFTVLTAAVIGVSIWFAASPEGWRSFENQYGPVRAVITFVLAAATALLGLKRTAAAGVLLVVLGTVPVAVSSMGTLSGLGSLAAVSSALVVSGILYLLSARTTGQSAPTEQAEAGPGELPKAA